MNGKLTALVILPVILFGLIVPMGFESSDALEPEEFYITVPSTKAPVEPIEITVGNGTSKSLEIMVVNASEKYLTVSYSSVLDNKDIVFESIPGTALLNPESMGGNTSTQTVVITASMVSPAYIGVTGILTVDVADASEPATIISTEIVFNISVESVFDTSDNYNKFFGMIPNKLPEPLNSCWVAMIVTMIVDLLIAAIFCKFFVPALARHLNKMTPDDDVDKFEKQIFNILIPIIFIMTLNQGLTIVGAPAMIISSFDRLAIILCIIMVTVLLWIVYLFVVEAILTKLENFDNDSPVDRTLMPLFTMIGKILFWVGGVAAILASFGVDFGGILISAGVISLGITLGAQSILSQFFSGLVILVTRPFNVGDYLKINDKVYIVKSVKIMNTEFTSWEKDQIITMPNNVVTAATICNMTKEELPVKQYVYFSVAYGTDVEKASKVMIDAARTCDLIVEDGKYEAPSVRVTGFLSSGIELRLAVFAKTFDDTGQAAGEIRKAVYKAFAENGITIPYERVQVDILSDTSGKRREGDFVED
jgi:small-conductance mechanosensitive channel